MREYPKLITASNARDPERPLQITNERQKLTTCEEVVTCTREKEEEEQSSCEKMKLKLPQP